MSLRPERAALAEGAAGAEAVEPTLAARAALDRLGLEAVLGVAVEPLGVVPQHDRTPHVELLSRHHDRGAGRGIGGGRRAGGGEQGEGQRGSDEATQDGGLTLPSPEYVAQ
jgi:hypothetical protein